MAVNFHTVIANIRAQLVLFEANTVGGAGLADKWDEFIRAYLQEVARYSQTYVSDRISQATFYYVRTFPANAQQVYLALADIAADIPTMQFPGYPLT